MCRAILPSDIEHVVFTDHAGIQRRARPPGGSLPADAALAPFWAAAWQAHVTWGLAYAMVGKREHNSIYIERAVRLLQQNCRKRPRRCASTSPIWPNSAIRDRKDDAHALPLWRG